MDIRSAIAGAILTSACHEKIPATRAGLERCRTIARDVVQASTFLGRVPALRMRPAARAIEIADLAGQFIPIEAALQIM